MLLQLFVQQWGLERAGRGRHGVSPGAAGERGWGWQEQCSGGALRVVC